MRAIGKRFSSMSDYTVEFDENGKIQKLKHHFVHDQGCCQNEIVQDNTSKYIGNAYDTRSWDISTQNVISNSASSTWMR
jgi:xanthine dehydrogenase molybdopterin-binding subunit B